MKPMLILIPCLRVFVLLSLTSLFANEQKDNFKILTDFILVFLPNKFDDTDFFLSLVTSHANPSLR